MTICAHTKKNIKCPVCGSGDVYIYYDRKFTVFRCGNYRKCYAALKLVDFVSFHHDDPRYPKIRKITRFFFEKKTVPVYTSDGKRDPGKIIKELKRKTAEVFDENIFKL